MRPKVCENTTDARASERVHRILTRILASQNLRLDAAGHGVAGCRSLCLVWFSPCPASTPGGFAESRTRISHNAGETAAERPSRLLPEPRSPAGRVQPLSGVDA